MNLPDPLVIPIPRHIFITANGRYHWADKSRRTREIRSLARFAARATDKRLQFAERVRILVEVASPTARRRDVHNVMPTIKAAIDGLVDAGWLTDDSDAYIQGPDLRPAAEKCDPALACSLTFTFEPIAEAVA